MSVCFCKQTELIFLQGKSAPEGQVEPALLFLDQIKREKGVWWMPWQQEAMKDVVPCVKPWGAGNRL
jgi:hypothetical protein